MKSVAIITSIEPSPINAGGLPSGLIWEIIETLKENNVECDVYVYPESKGLKINRILNRYGFYLKNAIWFLINMIKLLYIEEIWDYLYHINIEIK